MDQAHGNTLGDADRGVRQPASDEFGADERLVGRQRSGAVVGSGVSVMLGTSLAELRDHIESLATEDGTHYVVCGQTGTSPVPAAGLRFPNRSVAREAVRATEQYRAALRRYDPRTPHFDLLVCEEPAADPADSGGVRREVRDWSPSTPALDESAGESAGRGRVDFCHRVAGAIFEALSEGGYRDIEAAVIDAYVERAEQVPDPDDLCLCLLERLATAFDDHLTPDEQAAVVAAAAGRLPDPDRDGQPVTAALRELERHDLLGGFTCAPTTIDRAARTRSVRVSIADYALSATGDRLPVLPLVVELYRQRPAWTPRRVRVEAGDRHWRVTVELGESAGPEGLARAPISP